MTRDAETDSAFHPLAGLRVLDATSNVAGPLATLVLARLGADVVKIERPETGDPARHWAPARDGVSYAFRAYNRGKRSVIIDMASQEGRQLIDGLLDASDVFVHSLQPRVADKYRLDRKAVLGDHPGLVYCEVGAFGRGPFGRERPGYDPVAQAFSGLMDMTGVEGMPPSRVPVSLIDYATGLWAALVVVATVAGRPFGSESPTNGRHIEVNLIDTVMDMLSYQATEALLTGQRPERFGSGHALGAPHQVFDTSDLSIFVAAPAQGLWLKLIQVLGMPELALEERFVSNADRVEHITELADVLGRVFATQSSAHWLHELTTAGVPAVPVLSLDAAVRHDLAAERNWFEVLDDDLPFVRSPPLVDGMHLVSERPLPRLGEHTRTVLADAGYDDRALDALQAAGVIDQASSHEEDEVEGEWSYEGV